MNWLEDRGAISSDSIETVLYLSAINGDRSLYDRLLGAAKSSKDPQQTNILLNAMSSFSDQEIVKIALGEILTDHFDSRTSLTLLAPYARNPQTHRTAFTFMKQNYEAIMEKLPKTYGAFMPRYLGDTFDDSATRSDMEDFFRARVAKVPGGPRMLDQVLEGISIREARNKAQQASVIAFLSNF
jgi:hypothetical protein